jgi:multidrug resistance protein, MATE family
MMSVGILTAHQLGVAQKLHTAAASGPVLWAGLMTAAVLSLPVTIALSSTMYPLWIRLGQTPDVARLASDFLAGLKWVVFADLAKIAIFQFAAAHHRPRVTLVASLVSTVLTVLASMLLMEHFGLYGLGLGNALTQWIVLLGLSVYLLRNSYFRRQLSGFPASLRIAATLCWEQLRLGMPMGAIALIELLFFAALSILMGQLGIDRLAAHQITMQWLWLTIMVAFGFSEAVTIMVAHARGRGDQNDILGFSRAGALLAFVSMLAVASIYWLAPEWIIQLDLAKENSHTAVVQLAISMLAACGFYQLLDGLRFTLSGSLRGLADTQYPMWLSLITFWMVGLPIAYISAFVVHWDSMGLWLGPLVADSVMVICLVRRLKAKVQQALPLNS